MQSSNVVFIMNIKLTGSGRWSESRSAAYEYSIKSWKHFCDKYGYKLVVLEDLIYDINEMGLCWQRYYMFDVLKQNEIEYDQVLMVDADTIVHPKCPNFFEMTNHEFAVATFDASFDWVIRSLENYSRYIFDDKMIDVWKYFSAGFIIVNKKHEQLYKDIVKFYWKNQHNLKEVEKLHTGSDQTPTNFLVQNSGIPVTYLPWEYNAVDMHRKEILNEDMLFTKLCNVMHFCCIPNNENNRAVNYWIKKTYQYLYESN